MNRQLWRRLDRLESQINPEGPPSAVFIMHPIPEEKRNNLAPGERIVLDHYRQTGFLISAAERVTTDPADCGGKCEPGGYLEDVIQRLHAQCYWRERGGSCNSCDGTPVAHT